MTTSTTPPGRRADQLIERARIGTVDQLHTAAFDRPRDPRSAEYKAGVRAALEFRIEGAPIARPYPAGTAQDDAFDGGLAEGHAIWRAAAASVAGAA
jgi:hypothetical protein